MSQTGIIFVTIKDEQKAFRLDLNAVADLEDLFDKGISEILDEKNIGFRTIRAFYWAGLKFKDKGLTVERAGNIVQSMLTEGQSFKEMMAPVTKALIASGILKKQKNDSDESTTEEESEEPKN